MFLAYQIGFADIPKVVDSVMSAHDCVEYPSMEDVLDADVWARDYARRQRAE